jgi:spore maturation protein CgeB
MKVTVVNGLTDIHSDTLIDALKVYFYNTGYNTKSIKYVRANQDTILIKGARGRYIDNLSTKEVMKSWNDLMEGI